MQNKKYSVRVTVYPKDFEVEAHNLEEAKEKSIYVIDDQLGFDLRCVLIKDYVIDVEEVA